MKNFFRKFICFVILLIIVFFVILKICPIKSDSYYAAFLDKELLLKSSNDENRLIFIGGSNLAFGVDSKYIQDSLKLNVINLGLNAGLGLKFMIDDVSQSLKSGDVLVIAPEYDLFWGDNEASSPLAAVCNIAPWAIKFLNLNQLRSVVVNMPEMIKTEAWFSKNKHDTQNVYSRSSFNSFGDVVRHHYLKRDDIIPVPNPPETEVNNEKLVYFSKFVKQERSNGVRVLILPPVFAKSSFDQYANKIEELDSLMNINNCGFEVSPLRYALNDSLFFNSQYHTSWEGRKQRTDLILSDIKHLLYSSKTEIQ